MTQFFKLGASGATRVHVIDGMRVDRVCFACAPEGRQPRRPHGTVEIQRADRSSELPDTLACDTPLLLVSQRVLDDWRDAGIGDVPAERVVGLDNDYFRIDGGRMSGAKVDFDASGFVDVRFCAECGTRTDNVTETTKRHYSWTWPTVIVEGSWTGAHLFTTDISPAAFFCTDLVVECARRGRHTNFRFVPIDEPGTQIKYL